MTFGLSAAAIGGIAAGAGAIGGALISGNAAEGAANTQAGAARDATEAQRQMFERQIALQEPWRQAGGVGLNALLYGLGLSPRGTFTAGAAPSGPALLQPGADGVFAPAGGGGGETAAQIRARLAPQFTTSDGGMHFVPNDETGGQWVQGGSTVNEAGLAAAVQQAIQHQQGAQTAQAPAVPAVQPAAGAVNPAAAGGPGYGGLLASAPEFKPFSQADFQADPGYAFRQSEQQKALERAASTRGGIDSGKFYKDALAYSGNLASQEFGNASNRYNANQDAIYNRFTGNQNSQFNKLASLAGIGQTATNTLTTAAGNFGQQAGSNIIGAGNAQAAGQVGSANALNGAIGQGVSLYQQNQMLQRFPFYGGSPYGGGPAFNPGPGTVGDFPMSYFG